MYTVAQLIEKLSTFPRDYEVRIPKPMTGASYTPDISVYCIEHRKAVFINEK
jgi:hypothetical protein